MSSDSSVTSVSLLSDQHVRVEPPEGKTGGTTGARKAVDHAAERRRWAGGRRRPLTGAGSRRGGGGRRRPLPGAFPARGGGRRDDACLEDDGVPPGAQRRAAGRPCRSQL